MREPTKIEIHTKSDRERIFASIQRALSTDFKSALIVSEGGITKQALETIPDSVNIFIVGFHPPGVEHKLQVQEEEQWMH